jgi:hypothetical protein
MKFSPKYYRAAIMLAVVILAFCVDVSGQSERGIHFTPEEVKIWRQRTISGPYKTAGDVSPGSPGDWTRILNQANAFLINSSKDRVKGGDGNYHNEPHRNHVNMKDAAFVYLITKDRKYFDAVKKELLAQIQAPGTDPSKWPFIGDMGRWVSAEWISRLLFAYDYIKADLTSTERAQLDQWFAKAGRYFSTNIHQNLALLFPNRLKEDYSVRKREAESGKMRDKYTHINKDGSKGNRMSYLSSWYNNRRSVQMRTVGLIGAFLNDKEMQFHAKLYIKEMLMFGTYPDGTMGEYERNGNYGNPQAGMTYSAFNIQAATDIADALARKGDFDLYNYSTSKGLYGTQGGNKSIKLIVENYYRQTDLSVERYHQKVDIRNRIDSENEFGGNYGIERWANDIWYTMSNVYWKSDYFKKVYMRKVGPPYPTKNLSGCGSVHHPWGGLGGSYPGVLFMFGQMEGKVWPYPTSGNILLNLPTAPSNLTATPLSTTEIRLNWKKHSNDETNFLIEVSNNSGSSFTLLKEVGANTTSFTHTGLPAGVTRHYRVLAKNGGGNSAYSNVAITSTLPPIPTIPGVPTNLSATGISNHQIELKWKDNSINGTKLIVEFSNSPTGGFTHLTEINANITSFVHSDLVPNQTIYYRIKAENAGGGSGYSDIAVGSSLCNTSKMLVTANGSTSFCEGQSLVLSTLNGFSAYEWSDGQTTSEIAVDISGQYSVKVMDDFGCWSAFSDPIDIKVFPAPEKPLMIIEGDSLFTNLNTSHQWVLNNRTILGATYDYYIPLKAGNYSVIVTDNNGCSSQSENAYTDNVRGRIVKVFPNPNNGQFRVEIDNPQHFEYELTVYSTLNETILQKTLSNFDNKIMDDIDVRQYGKGIYLIKIHYPGTEPIVEKILVK